MKQSHIKKNENKIFQVYRRGRRNLRSRQRASRVKLKENPYDLLLQEKIQLKRKFLKKPQNSLIVHDQAQRH